MRRALHLVLRAVAIVLLAVAMVMLHLPTRAGRRAVREVVRTILPGVIPGQLHIGSVDVLSPTAIRVSGVSWADDKSAPMIDNAVVAVTDAWRLLPAALGYGDFPPIAVRADRLHARVPYLRPTATSPTTPASGPPTRYSIRYVTIDVAEIVSELPGIDARATHTHVNVGIRIAADGAGVHVRQIDTMVRAMGLPPERLTGFMRLTPGPHLMGNLALRGDALSCDLHAGDDPSGRLRADLSGCRLTAAALDQLAGRTPGESLSLRAAVDDLTVTGSTAAGFDLRAAVHLNEQPVHVEVHATMMTQIADVRFDHVVLQDVVAELPRGDLDGSLHLERRVQGAAQHFSLDTAALVAAVADVPVPPLHLDALLEGQTLLVERFDAPEIGLASHGTFDIVRRLAHFRAAADLETPELARLHWVAGRVHGALRLHVHAHGEGDRVAGDIEVYARRLGMRNVRLDEGGIAGRADYAHGRPDVDLEVHTRGLSVGHALGPLAVDGNVQGDPMHAFRVSVTAHGDGLLAALGAPSPAATAAARDTALTTHATVAIEPNAIAVAINHSTVDLRGSRGGLTGAVRIPRGTGLPLGHLRLEAATHGTVEVTLTGTRVALRLGAFDLSWLAPVVGRDELAGVANGELDMNTSAISESHAHLTLRDAAFDPIGRFNAALDVLHNGERLFVRAAVNTSAGARGYGRGASATAEVHVRVPSHLGSVQGWLDGVDHGAVDLTGVDLHAFHDLLPSRLMADGHIVAHADIHRVEAAGPLELTAGVDGRSLVFGTVFGAAVHPLRLRAVACTRARSVAETVLPLTLRVGLGLESNPRPDPTEPPPQVCDARVPLLHETIVDVGAILGGPWVRALTDAVAGLRTSGGATDWPANIRDELARATIDATARVSLLRSKWPLRSVVPLGFSADQGVVLLRPPDVSENTRLDLNARVSGTMLGPTVDVESDYTSANIHQIGEADPVEGHVVLRVAPAAGDLLGIVRITLNGMGVVASAASPPGSTARGQVALDVHVQGDGSDLLSQGLAAAHVQRFDVDTQNLAFDRFSWARTRRIRGNFGLQFTAASEQNIGAAFTVSNFQAHVGDVLTGHDTPPVQGIVRTSALSDAAGDWNVHTCAFASLGAASVDCDPQHAGVAPAAGAFRADATIPLTGGLMHLAPALDRASAAFHARAFRLDDLEPFVRGETIAQLEGELTSDLAWSGAAPRQLQGAATLHDGRIELVAIGEPFRNVTAEITANGGALHIVRLDTSLGRGDLHSTGEVTLGQDVAHDPLATVQVTSHAAAFPVEQEGNTFGWVTGDVRVDVVARPESTHLTVDVQHAAVLVQEASTRTLQPLGADPDVYVFGRSALNPTVTRRDTSMVLQWQIDTPVWLRRSDFAVAINGHGSLRLDASGMAMDGTIESASTQSWFAILGKRFSIDRIGVTFDGNIGLNPELDVAAHLESPSVGRLSVVISGRMRAPVMTFASERYPDASQSEVLSMIVLGRMDSGGASSNGDLATSASNAAGSLVAGMTMGLVTSALQSQISFLPTIIADPGETNGGRYGAGVSVSPRLYIQATYGASAAPLGTPDTSAATQSEVRVFGEYAVSPRISVSATYGTALNRWGADVFWSP